jgi:hypothetical protein
MGSTASVKRRSFLDNPQRRRCDLRANEYTALDSHACGLASCGPFALESEKN